MEGAGPQITWRIEVRVEMLSAATREGRGFSPEAYFVSEPNLQNPIPYLRCQRQKSVPQRLTPPESGARGTAEAVPSQHPPEKIALAFAAHARAVRSLVSTQEKIQARRTGRVELV